MGVNNIGPVERLSPPLDKSISGQKNAAGEGTSFINFLKDALEEVNESQLEAQKLARDFALGKIDNIHTVTIAAQKAELALDLTLAIRNKVIEAYKELMRMQF